MTWGPSELTQAMHSCAAVTFFLFAMSFNASTMAKLCLIDCGLTNHEFCGAQYSDMKSYVFLESREVAAEITLCTMHRLAYAASLQKVTCQEYLQVV